MWSGASGSAKIVCDCYQQQQHEQPDTDALRRGVSALSSTELPYLLPHRSGMSMCRTWDPERSTRGFLGLVNNYPKDRRSRSLCLGLFHSTLLPPGRPLKCLWYFKTLNEPAGKMRSNISLKHEKTFQARRRGKWIDVEGYLPREFYQMIKITEKKKKVPN